MSGETRSPRHPYRALAVLGWSCLAFSIAQTMLFPALPALIDGLDTNENDIAWTLTIYLLVAGVATPLFGRLGDMFGNRRMLVISIAAYTVGALISAVSTGLWMMVGGRALAGVGGAVFPLSFSLARELLPARQVPRAIGLLAGSIVAGSAFGLVFAGVIVDHLSWQWIFWASAAMGVIATIALRFQIPDSTRTTGGRVDVRGAVVLGIGLTLPLIAISRAGVWGWGSLRTVGLIAAGLLVLAVWVWLELRTDEPLADIASLRSRPVLVTNLATLPAGFAIQATFVLVVLVAQTPTSTGYGFGLGATGAGLILVPGALLATLASPLSGALGARIGNKFPLAIGGFVATLALVLVGYRHDSLPEFVVYVALFQGGFGLAFAALPNLIIDAVPPAITGESMSVNTVIARVGSSVGIQATATIVASSAVAGSTVPTDRGYAIAFFLCAAVSLVGAIVALFIPRATRRGHGVPRGEPAASGLIARAD